MHQSDEQAPPQKATMPWLRHLWEPCDIASVVFFRIAFAGTMLAHAVMVMRGDWIEYYFARPYHLKFYGFEWVKALDANGMWWIHVVMGLAAIGVFLGLFYRLSTMVLFVTYTYTLLSEAAFFQNHYYLMSLAAFLFVLIPAHRSFSIDAIIFPQNASLYIPNWCRWVLMFLIGVPYFYGGIAKLNGDWLHAMPLAIWIPQKSHFSIIGPLLAQPWVPWVLSYAGLFLDLLVVPLLLWRKTRLLAYIAVVTFHLMNSVLFSIDVFPWMMILVTTIFFDPDWPRKLLRRPSLTIPNDEIEMARKPSLKQRAVLGIVGIFVVWQLVFPLRCYAYPGNSSWTEEGSLFAWHMMLRHKDAFLRFYATDGLTGQTVAIPVSRLLSHKQLWEISLYPEQIPPVAHFFAEGASRVGLKQVEIHAVVLISLNGRKPQLMFDPNLDLLTVERTWKHQSWLYPLTEPLRPERWDVPTKEWPQLLGVDLPKTTSLHSQKSQGHAK